MFVLEILPLARSAPPGTLSYRSRAEVVPGSLVSVPLRKQQVRGIVVECVPVKEAKGVLKRATFALKSSGSANVEGALPRALMLAAEEVAACHAAPLGSTLHALLADSLPPVVPVLTEGPGANTLYIEAPYRARIDAYEKLIRKQGRASHSVVIVAPTGVELERLARDLAAFSPVAVSGALTGRKRAAALTKAVDAGLVIVTPAFSWLPVRSLGALVVERASAAGYRLPQRPHLDLRIAAASLARARGAQLAYGDYPLPIELRDKADAPLSAPARASARIIDATAERPEGERAPFRAVAQQMLAELGRASARGGRAAVLAVRKGYAPTVVCRDCGFAVRDANGRALSFSIARGERVFRSADGQTNRAADLACDRCGSWNLLPLGIGVERVAQEIEEALPDARVCMLDAESIRTPAAVRKAMARIKEPGTIVVGTEAMLPLLDPAEPLEYAAIASADSLLALPFWRARERFVHAGLTLLDRAKSVSVATRRPLDTAVLMLADTTLDVFFAEETAQRKALRYPPFGHLLVFHAEASPTKVAEAAKLITDALADLPSVRLPDRPVRTHMRLSIIAKVASDQWPDAALSALLAALPPWISLTLDTESLW